CTASVWRRQRASRICSSVICSFMLSLLPQSLPPPAHPRPAGWSLHTCSWGRSPRLIPQRSSAAETDFLPETLPELSPGEGLSPVRLPGSSKPAPPFLLLQDSLTGEKRSPQRNYTRGGVPLHELLFTLILSHIRLQRIQYKTIFWLCQYL